jgi:hypothetical protein
MPTEVEMAKRAGQLAFGVFLWIWCLSPGLGVFSAAPVAQAPVTPAAAPAVPSDADIEQFLLNAKIVKTRPAGKGVTNTLRATMSDGTLTHDVHIQTIDETKKEFRSAKGVEFNFRDSWMYNVAAYKIDRLLGMGLVPVSVPRRHNTAPGAFTWWVDDVMMDEGDRLKNKVSPPDSVRWNEQMQLVRLFDQLIYNIDRNLGNLLITNDWTVWAIDHTRAFRTQTELKSPESIGRCDRHVFERLKELDRPALKAAVGTHLQNWEIDSLLKRRDAIVVLIEKRGPNALFDWQRE